MMNQSKLASIMAPASRRNFIGEGGKLSALAVALLVGSERMAKGASPSPNDVGILNTALGLEYHGIAAYQVGAESKLLKPATLKVAVQFQSDHKKHADALASTIVKLGGSPVLAKTPADYNFPTSKLKTQADVLTFAAGLEQVRFPLISALFPCSKTETSPKWRQAFSATKPSICLSCSMRSARTQIRRPS